MKTIEDSLKTFISEPSYGVAVLKGDWGIGKTHFWREFYKSSKKTLPFKAYSYVSLFGTEKLGDIKKQIFSNFEMLDQEKLSKHFEKLKPISTVLDNIKIPYINASASMSELIDSKLIENFLICIDDLERKESSISVAAILGLISNLKEEKNCKILLIYNDKELDEKTRKEIDEYREKVVDLELTYNPSIKENLSIIWNDGSPTYIHDIFESLNLNNIRIMERVKWALDHFDHLLGENYGSSD